MAWTDVITKAVGDPVIAADWNTYVRDNPSYLKGQAGTVRIENSLYVGTPTGSFQLYTTGVNPIIDFTAAGDFIGWDSVLFAHKAFIGNNEKLRVDANGVNSHDGTTLMRVQRHPYSNNRHIESGIESATDGATVDVTYASAFAALPMLQHKGYNTLDTAGSTQHQDWNITAAGATGFSIQNQTGDSRHVHWLAEGAD